MALIFNKIRVWIIDHLRHTAYGRRPYAVYRKRLAMYRILPHPPLISGFTTNLMWLLQGTSQGMNMIPESGAST